MLRRTIQKIRAALNELCRPGVSNYRSFLVECQGGVLDVCRDRECKGLRDGEGVREDLATDWVLSRLPCTDVELVRPDASAGLQVLAVDLDAEPIRVLVNIDFARVTPVHGAKVRRSDFQHICSLRLVRQFECRQYACGRRDDEFDM